MEQFNSYKCIFCLQEKPKSNFNKEHVLQEGFGKFKGALTLTKEVCSACNESFGQKIDLILGRDSFEAFLRLHYKIKPVKEAKDIIYDHLTMSIPNEVQGDWAGVKIAYQPPSISLLPQLGFIRKSTGNRVYFTISELKNRRHLNLSDIDKKIDVKIISNKKDERDKLNEFLDDMGIPLESRVDFVPTEPKEGETPIKLEYFIDENIARGIAKVSFNYLTKMCGAEFALKDDFNTIRQFIQSGKLPPGQLKETIEPSNKQILANDDYKNRRLGHIVALEWDITKKHILGRVSLFNSISWTIMLAKNFSGIFREIKSCHFYDIRNRVVKRLHAVSRELIP